MTPTPRSGAGMTANEIEKRNCKELLEIVETLADEGERATTAAVVERFFDDPAENARYGNPVGGYLADLEAHGYVRREAREDGDGGSEDVWTDAQPAAFHDDYVADADALWPPKDGETP